eukprot:TRINITY_DN7095_c0_g2_i3.p1 TRINITY_DN7095_c0_g2~~TRINITY_DN7095_c0_g2_i3.p1  ORF type:complete len:174 (-),score=37.88 TRINITY_DN7095_c0_g2_i3:49-570(-)
MFRLSLSRFIRATPLSRHTFSKMAHEVACERPDSNPVNEEIARLLTETRTIAMVGASDKPERDSYMVMQYLLTAGYQVIPINPTVASILGQRSYASLAQIPANISIDMVDVFRKPEALPEVFEEALARGTKSIWLQLGLAYNQGAQKAREQGVVVVQNKCIKIEHKKRFGANL